MLNYVKPKKTEYIKIKYEDNTKDLKGKSIVDMERARNLFSSLDIFNEADIDRLSDILVEDGGLVLGPFTNEMALSLCYDLYRFEKGVIQDKEELDKLIYFVVPGEKVRRK